ncbi:MAG: YIP1 family protein [Chloroflexi bacterium]|nr:YIP1 family protein [Chloroflexota bacterium]
MIDRMIRAARLDVSLYEEVERDTKATSQALQVVIIVALATGIGNLISMAVTPRGLGGGAAALLAGIIGAAVFWAVWSFLIFLIGTKFFGGTATYGEVLRCIGFADTPGVLNILRFIPVLGGLISLIVFIWLIVAGVIAVRQSLDIDTGKAIAVAFIAGIIGIIAMGIVMIPFGVAMM